ncbi:MAG TPA: NlpC/P60 family protein [Micromonosporaceae bacterium]|nr:NlpC/P60 family protein [Micromonosporaceae bacterium]
MLARSAVAAALLTLCVATPAAAAGDDPKPTKAQLDKQISTASNQLEVVIERYDAMQDTLAATRARETAVVARLAPMQAAADAAQEKVAQIAAQTYEATPLSGFALLVDAQSTQQVVDRLTLLNGLAIGRRSTLDTLVDATTAYRLQQQTLRTLDEQQASLVATLATQKTAIQSQIKKLESIRVAAFGPSGVDSSAHVINYVPAYSADAAGRAVKFAHDQIGKPYKWAAAGPDSYDCSGLTMAAWKQGGVTLPHNSAEQYSAVAHISRSQLRPGDLVFYYTPIHHVAIYIGGGYVIEAPQVGEDVKIASVDLGPIHGYGRPA